MLLKTPPKTATEQPYNPNRSGANQMSPKALISALILSVSLSASQALAKPEMTPEQLAKARETAALMKPPVDFDALLDEADRLGVVCEGELTIRANIRTCINGVKIAQSKERQAKLGADTARLREENEQIEDRLKRKVHDLADKAEQKLKQIK
jgi:hypothetical protein